MTPSFEQGPIRPPSEAHSLLVRVTRNCPWNKCAFCPVYKHRPPSNRDAAEVLADIDAMAAAAEVLREEQKPFVDPHDPYAGARDAVRRGAVPPEAVQVALFLADGARSAFLQDADPFVTPPARLAQVVRRVHERFPGLERVTTYARAATLARRSADGLAEVRAAGLSRVHVGLESGADEVLTRVAKGCTAAQAIDAGRKTLAAGFELCFYVMPGLGGRELSAVHAAGTARVVREVAAAAATERPLTVRLRTTAAAAGTPLGDELVAGRYELPDDVEIAHELRAFLAALGEARLRLVSDHSLNLLPELEGEWPADRARLLGTLDELLGLPDDERAAFALGRRLGAYWTLADRHDRRRRALVDETIAAHGDPGPAELLRAAAKLRARCV